MAFDPGKWPLLWWQKLARRGGYRLRRRHACRYRIVFSHGESSIGAVTDASTTAEAIDTSTLGIRSATRCPQCVESRVSVVAKAGPPWRVSAAILGYAQAARLPLQFRNINFCILWNFLLDLSFQSPQNPCHSRRPPGTSNNQTRD